MVSAAFRGMGKMAPLSCVSSVKSVQTKEKIEWTEYQHELRLFGSVKERSPLGDGRT